MLKKLINFVEVGSSAGATNPNGGQCLVNWDQVCMPTKRGSFGILEIHKYARALKLQWLWHEKVSPTKPWVGLGMSCSAQDRELFTLATEITIGNGERTLF